MTGSEKGLNSPAIIITHNLPFEHVSRRRHHGNSLPSAWGNSASVPSTEGCDGGEGGKLHIATLIDIWLQMERLIN